VITCRAIGLILAIFLAAGGSAEAQLPMRILLSHTALGAIRHVDAAGHETTTVILNGKAASVYAFATGVVQRNAALRITQQDDAKRTFAFTDGQRTASIRVSSLGDDVCQLIATSDKGKNGQGSPASLILDATLRICGQLGVQCAVSAD
jgi:hypothetical protein